MSSIIPLLHILKSNTTYILVLLILPMTYLRHRPYKLTPATEGALSKLNVMIVTETLRKDLNLQECSICQEELEVGCAIAEMPGCGHCFHNECVMKWFALVSAAHYV